MKRSINNKLKQAFLEKYDGERLNDVTEYKKTNKFKKMSFISLLITCVLVVVILAGVKIINDAWNRDKKAIDIKIAFIENQYNATDVKCLKNFKSNKSSFMIFSGSVDNKTKIFFAIDCNNQGNRLKYNSYFYLNNKKIYEDSLFDKKIVIIDEDILCKDLLNVKIYVNDKLQLNFEYIFE